MKRFFKLSILTHVFVLAYNTVMAISEYRHGAWAAIGQFVMLYALFFLGQWTSLQTLKEIQRDEFNRRFNQPK